MRRVKQTTECATRSDGNCYNDENDDSDECDDDDDDDADDADDNDDNGDESEGVDSLSGDSDSRKINNTNFRASLSQPHSKGKAVEAQKCSSINAQEQEQLPSPLSSPVKNDIYCLTSKKLLRCSTGAVLADTTQTCLVKIPKLPVCSQNGKVFLKTTPLKIMPLHEHVASCAKNVDGGGQSRKKGDDKTMERTDNPVSVRRNCELQKTKDTELEKEHEEIQGFPNMQELQSKSRHDEDSTERCLNSTMERRGSADSGAILSTSKFESLFSMAEHCRPRRKEAIVKSATKVADWLSTHDVSSNVIDVTETCNTGLDNEGENGALHCWKSKRKLKVNNLYTAVHYCTHTLLLYTSCTQLYITVHTHCCCIQAVHSCTLLYTHTAAVYKLYTAVHYCTHTLLLYTICTQLYITVHTHCCCIQSVHSCTLLYTHTAAVYNLHTAVHYCTHTLLLYTSCTQQYITVHTHCCCIQSVHSCTLLYTHTAAVYKLYTAVHYCTHTLLLYTSCTQLYITVHTHCCCIQSVHSCTLLYTHTAAVYNLYTAVHYCTHTLLLYTSCTQLYITVHTHCCCTQAVHSLNSWRR